MIVDQNYVDVPFDQIIKTDPDKFGGYLPTDYELARGFPDYELSGMPIYPRLEWPGLIRQREEAKAWPYYLTVYPHDQGREGSCVYNMAAWMMQIIWNMQFGWKNAIQFSPMSGYRWNARSASSGSMVGQAGTWTAGTGLLPSDRPEVKARLQPEGVSIFHPNTGWSNSFADYWKSTAKFFRIDEWFRVTSVEAWVSAEINGFVCGGGRDGHAVGHGGLTIDGGKLYSIYCNSWGAWGATLETVAGMIRSFGYDSETKIRTMVARDAWAVRSIVVPSFMLSA